MDAKAIFAVVTDPLVGKEYREQTVYEPPMEQDLAEQVLPEETFDELTDDDVHLWRMNTGIELVHKEPTLEELERIWQNWLLMTPQQKIISDIKSVMLFNKTNYEHYQELMAKESQHDTENT